MWAAIFGQKQTPVFFTTFGEIHKSWSVYRLNIDLGQFPRLENYLLNPS